MKLTPDQFAQELPKWYWIWRNANPGYFPVEERLTKKAEAVGFLEMADLVKITCVLGNPFNIRGKIQRANTEDEVKEKTRKAIEHFNEPALALESMMSIHRWGRTYASKTLRCICPRNYAALDSKLIESISQRYLRSRNEVKQYEEFLDLCQQIREKVSEPGPRESGAWFLADVEVALFQFVWDGGKIV